MGSLAFLTLATSSIGRSAKRVGGNIFNVALGYDKKQGALRMTGAWGGRFPRTPSDPSDMGLPRDIVDSECLTNTWKMFYSATDMAG